MFFEDRKIMVYKDPVDMRKSFDGLFSLVKSSGIFEGNVFIFLSKNRKRAKTLFWDGSGLNILMKRMEYGKFADIFRRDTLRQEELYQFYQGSKTIARTNIQLSGASANKK